MHAAVFASYGDVCGYCDKLQMASVLVPPPPPYHPHPHQIFIDSNQRCYGADGCKCAGQISQLKGISTTTKINMLPACLFQAHISLHH